MEQSAFEALRFCGKHECITCPCDIGECIQMVYAAADQIERDQKEIAELREENERLTRRLFEPHPVPTTSTL